MKTIQIINAIIMCTGRDFHARKPFRSLSLTDWNRQNELNSKVPTESYRSWFDVSKYHGHRYQYQLVWNEWYLRICLHRYSKLLFRTVLLFLELNENLFPLQITFNCPTLLALYLHAAWIEHLSKGETTSELLDGWLMPSSDNSLQRS